MTASGPQEEPGGVRLGAIATGQATVNQAGRDLHVHLGRGVALGAGAGSGADGAGLRVFVSHTSELREFPAGGSYVDAVERAISACGHVIVDMADFPAADLPPAELCAERVASCDVYLGVLGTRYGSLVRDRPELSYTELEFEAATEAGLERLVFVLDIAAADVGIPLQLLLDLEYGARQQAFGHRAQESGLVTQKFASPAALGQLVERSLVELTERRRLAALVAEVAVVAPVEPPDDSSTQLQAYLTSLAESYQWLELQGIREAGSLRIELEKVYVALKAEPETEYDLRHLANLHTQEVREAAGGTSLDLIEPSELALLDAENVRRTYQPRRDEARRSSVTDVKTIADAFRVHHRIVLLGGPGSGKTTLGHWLALQLARGLLRQLPRQVAPDSSPVGPNVVRMHVPAGASWSFSESHFAPLLPAGKLSAITIDALPGRGAMALFGSAVTVGQVVRSDQIDRLTFTPVGNECGTRYAQLQFSAAGDWASPVACAIAMDVGSHVQVPVSQVNPDYRRSDGPERFEDLGPARVPVFLRLAHFARELAERERGQQPTLSLEEYLGRDPDSCGRPDGCDPDIRNALLRQYLDDGQAVVILDGLDELPEANRRTVSLKIQDFIEKFTEPTAADESRVPSLAGGNQVIVSSRYVGYKLMPIRSGCVHFGIQAMQRPAVEHFARAWVAAINAELGADFPGRLGADALISEIYDDARPAIRELATNPLLITILATVYWADGRLPDRRAGVYDRVVENLLRIWLNRPECRAQSLHREVLLAALEPLAAEMQGDRASNGLISLDRIGELIEKPVALMLGSAPGDRSFRPVLDALLTAIRQHVGLLAEQSAGNYAFFHRTFQEFLAARYLLSDREHAAEMLVERLDDPQWREPLLLALGLAMISPEWGLRTRIKLLEDVLAGDDRDPLIPRASMLLVSALPDLKNVPRQVVGKVIKQLLTCYAFSQDQSQAEGLRAGICDVFVQLRRGPQADLTSEVISEMIRRPQADQDYSAAAAEILLRIDWFTTETVDALLQVAHRDQAALRWPVRWALLAALGQPSDSLAASSPTRALNTSRLLATHLPMRRLLESSPELTAFVRGDVGWLWLIVALYGGLGRVQVQERLRAHQHQRLLELQSAGDVSAAEPAGPPPPIPPIEFCPGDIVHDLADAELSRTIQRHLRLQRPSAELAETFRRVWDRGADAVGSAEAIVGLAALGEDVVPLVRGALAERDRQPAAQAALGRLRWLRSLLREPLLRSNGTAARTIPETAPEDHQLDLLRIVIEGRSVSGGGPLPVSDVIASGRLIGATSDSVRDALEAERLAYVFSGLSSGDADLVSTALATAADVDPRSPGPVMNGWPALSQARNLLVRPRLPWPQMPLAPRCETPVERYLSMLDGLYGSPSEYDYLAGYLLGQCRPLLDDHPSLVWETLAICWYRGDGFMEGYLAGASGKRVAGVTSDSVATEFASAWNDRRSTQGPTGDLLNDLKNILAWRVESIDEVGDSIVESSLSILREASLISDPYLRFRSLWRLVGIVSSGLEIPLGLDVVGLVESITEPHEKAQAYEWITMTIPDKQLGLRVSTSFLDRAARTLSSIPDPDNRARAQCRLAFLAPERLEDLIAVALASVGQIVDPERRAETIVDVRAALSGLSSLAEGLDRLADALPEQWLRDKAHGRTSRLIAAYRLDYGLGALVWRLTPEAAANAGAGADRHRLRYPNGHLAWGLLYLSAVAAEVGALEATATGSNADWEMLLSPDWQTGVDGLIESAADGGLRVSAREASVLNRVVQSGRAEIVAPLWSYLESPDPGAMAMISRWTEGDAQTERWRALVQAEAGQLTTENVTLVIELLVGPSDRLRARAALALHGRAPNTGNRNRRWSTRRVGVEAVETLASHARRIDHPPSVRSSLNWVQHDIHHDNAEALEHWLTEATASADAPANWILEYIESIDDALVPRLLESIPSAPPRLQRIQLIGLARVAHCSRALDGAKTDVRAAAATIPREIRRKVCIVLEGPVSYLKAAGMAAAAFDEGSRLDAARWKIEESMIWLDDDCLTDERACLRRLKLIGDGFYVHYYRGGYWDQADEAAAELAENEDALRLLLAWVESLSPAESSRARFSDILTAVESLARVSPNAFADLADPDVWEPMLTEWAETAEHWTARLAAVRLLSLLRKVTEHIAVALRTALSDVSFVQQAAYSAVGEFRRTKGDIISELLGPLDDPSASVAASTTRLLVSLARGEGETADRRRILRGLREAVVRVPKAGSVYLMQEPEGTGEMVIEFVDRLDRILYRAIFEVSGL